MYIKCQRYIYIYNGLEAGCWNITRIAPSIPGVFFRESIYYYDYYYYT